MDVPVSVRETHIGVVLLIGDRALKLKKPVRTEFLDFSTRERRERACHREVELNRRLAPEAYLGVADVHGPDGRPCEHLVVMARMPAERRLSAIAADGTSGGAEVRQIARTIAAFHARAERSAEISAAGNRDAVRDRWDGVLAAINAGDVLDVLAVEDLERLASRFLAGRAALFDDRVAAGRIVDGHGDLLTEDIFCLPDGPQILDCLEFDDRLRWVDGLDDAAFLAMDLEYHDRPDLTARFLRDYAEFSGDPAPAALRHHYVAYRAAVRARVAGVRAEQTDTENGGHAEAARDQAHRYAQIARRHLERAMVRLVLVGGLPGTGKSTVANRLAERCGFVVLSSDRLRKELAGIDPEKAAGADYQAGLYSTEMTERVYTELLVRAERLLGRGETVVLDASWTATGHRRSAARLAEITHSDLVALRCTAPRFLAEERLRTREGSASDADERIAAAMEGRAEPWPEAHEVPTDRALERTVDHAVDLVAPSASTTNADGRSR